MLTTALAILGTLAGSLMTGSIQYLTQRSQRAADTAAARRAEHLAAVTELATALTDHRQAMWTRETLRLQGEDWTQARTETRRTRSAITNPLLRVQLLLPETATTARAAVTATYRMREADSQTALTDLREHAIRQTDTFVTAAGTTLAA